MANSSKFPPNAFRKREEETFEDYTCVTDWESFTQALENVLSRWGLAANGDLSVRQELLSTVTPHPGGYLCGCLNYGEREFQLIYHNRNESDNSDADDLPAACLLPTFVGGTLPLSWFGLSRVLVLRPTEGRITGATRLSLLLSSIEMAVNSLRCPLPILVQYADSTYFHGLAAIPPLTDPNEDRAKQAYQSSILTGALNVDFSTGCLTGHLPVSCMHLAGLREIFLSKLGHPWTMNCPLPEITISAKFMYKLPFWPTRTHFPTRTHPRLSFNLLPLGSVHPQFLLFTVWPDIPSHAITQEATTKVLKPEGAVEWYLGVVIQTSGANYLSQLLKSFIKVCAVSSSAEFIQKPLKAHSIIRSRLSWLGADFPRLKSMFLSRPPDFPAPADSVIDEPLETEMTAERVLYYLLFLFPDADPNSTCSSKLAQELNCTRDASLYPLCTWLQRQHRDSTTISALARHLGLPSPTSLVHRLAVLLCNLCGTSGVPKEAQVLVMSMFQEFLFELKQRLDRGIRLPLEECYIESEQATSSPTKDKAGNSHASVDNKEHGTVFQWESLEHLLPTAPTHQTFAQWSDASRFNLGHLFDRFDQCILAANEAADRVEITDDAHSCKKEDLNDAFFDAVEDLSLEEATEVESSDSNPTPTEIAMEEARQMLTWLQSLEYAQLLRLLLPSVCLEALITVHSMIPDGRLTGKLAGALDRLDCEVYKLLLRLQLERSTLDGFKGYQERFTCTFTEILSVIGRFCDRITCFYELLEDCLQFATLSPANLDVDFLFDLSMRASFTCESCPVGWIPVPCGFGRGQKCFLTDFERLFGYPDPYAAHTSSDLSSSSSSTNRVGSIKPFHFQSSSPHWFSTASAHHTTECTLSAPDLRAFLLYTELGQPSPLASRPGQQRLYVELRGQSSDTVFLAGAFSRDTQFF